MSKHSLFPVIIALIFIASVFPLSAYAANEWLYTEFPVSNSIVASARDY